MKTREITRQELEGLEFICEGYKAVNWDSSTQGNNEFKYGEQGEPLVGKAFAVDGDISICNWGLHFSKDPAYVFNFYKPLGYNRYFKIRAYGKVVDAEDGFKSVAQALEFVEEYDPMQYIDIIKGFDRTASNAVRGSNAVSWSIAVRESNAVRESIAVSWSNAVSNSYGLRECDGIVNGLFCHKKEGAKNVIFNKKCTQARFDEVMAKIKSFNWTPQFENWYDIKGNKEWWAFCFPQLQTVDNDIAWGKMPQDMKDYIFGLPEFNQKIWDKITGK